MIKDAVLAVSVILAIIVVHIGLTGEPSPLPSSRCYTLQDFVNISSRNLLLLHRNTEQLSISPQHRSLAPERQHIEVVVDSNYNWTNRKSHNNKFSASMDSVRDGDNENDTLTSAR
ncbi:hypothetical protein BT63DRAFT_426618 [Microthyrium microscopicum]|uniref:Uncharacterized protein n=1 Tax=Microthyrium microscopicum TaxID=703497 RepID=A0A6A6U844_9PEZI|nr:hypothetical protein BT63DRAFT_426618 [Microthyrium microscopicum]